MMRGSLVRLVSVTWMTDDFQMGNIDRKTLEASVQGWINNVRYGNTAGF